MTPVAWAVIGADEKLLLSEHRTLLAYFDNPPRPLVWGDKGDYWDGIHHGMEANKALLKDAKDAISYCVQLFGPDFDGLLYRLNAAIGADAPPQGRDERLQER